MLSASLQHRFYTYKGLATRISINNDVTFNPHYGPPPNPPALFSLPETLNSIVAYTLSTVVLCIDAVPCLDRPRVSRVSN